jgi:hypothetical protein
MQHLITSITINASADKIWSVLADFDQYPNWNPFIRSISGDTFAGGKLKVGIQLPGKKIMNFTPTLLNFDQARLFRWKGKLFVKGLFDGEHYFRFEYIDDNTTKFIHGELFNGILVGLLGGVIEKSKGGFELMNIALKEQCEKG